MQGLGLSIYFAHHFENENINSGCLGSNRKQFISGAQKKWSLCKRHIPQEKIVQNANTGQVVKYCENKKSYNEDQAQCNSKLCGVQLGRWL